MSHGHSHGGEPCDGNHGHGGGDGIRHRGTRQAPLPDPEKDKAFAAEAFKRMADIDRNLAKKQPNPRREFWFVLSDPCGLVCAIITHFVVQFVNYVTVVKVIAPWLLTKDKYRWAFAHIFFFETIIVFIVLSHLKCMLSDPGTLTHFWNGKKMEKIQKHMEQYLVSRASGSTRVSRPWCAKCDNYKPVHTHHCSYCGTCIEGFDHHCPWMNNCVGKRNHKFFMLFLLYVGSGSGYAIVMTVYRMWSCMKVTPVMARAMDCRLEVPATLVFYIVSIVLALLFCLFVSCMGYEQLEEISDMTTFIEKKKGLESERVGIINGLAIKFRETFSCRWLLPIQAEECHDTFPPLKDCRKKYGIITPIIFLIFTCLTLYWTDALAAFLFSTSRRG